MKHLLFATCLAAGIGLSSVAGAGPVQAKADVPAGVRTLAARIGGDGGITGRNRGRPVVVFADGAARPVYFSESGATCVNDCLTRWQPFLAARGARESGDWSLVRADSGARQWAFRGKPLFTFANEPPFFGAEDLGADAGIRCGGAPSAPCFTVAPVLRGQGVDGMTAARAEPAAWVRMPNGIGAAEYRMAPGQILAVGVGGATPLGKPLYVFTGSDLQEAALPSHFQPHHAAELDLGVGDFSVRERPDGMRQWAYRGAPLYTCACDVESGDVNGRAPGMEPAILLRYFMPPETSLLQHPISGGYLIEARTGRTLYYRDRVKDPFEPDNSRPLGGPQDPAIGAVLGLKHCDAACEKEWLPLLARPNAQPQGYWSVYARPDGRKQWAYKNAAVYTRAGEAPGQLLSNETYQIRFDDGFGNQARDEFGLGLIWRAAMP